jgi:hypothetical protein
MVVTNWITLPKLAKIIIMDKVEEAYYFYLRVENFKAFTINLEGSFATIATT